MVTVTIEFLGHFDAPCKKKIKTTYFFFYWFLIINDGGEMVKSDMRFY